MTPTHLCFKVEDLPTDIRYLHHFLHQYRQLVIPLLQLQIQPLILLLRVNQLGVALLSHSVQQRLSFVIQTQLFVDVNQHHSVIVPLLAINLVSSRNRVQHEI